MSLKRRRPFSPREQLLLTALVVIVLGIGVDRVVRTTYLRRRSAIVAAFSSGQRRSLEASAKSQVITPPDGERPASLTEAVRAFDRLAKDRVAVLSMTPAGGDVGTGQTVTVDVAGDLGRVTEYLQLLIEDLGVGITGFEVSPAGTHGGDVRCRVTCTLSLSPRGHAAGGTGTNLGPAPREQRDGANNG